MKGTKLKLPIYLPWSAPLPRRARPWWPMGGSLKNCLQGARSFTGEHAPPQESAPPLTRARPFRLQRALSKFAHRGRALSQESAPLLMRARPSCPGGSSRIDQAKIRHSFALKMNVGARGLGYNLCIRYSLAVLFT
jgi:hypothetical protein